MKKYVIIVAGGSGTRMNKDIPKQFINLNGKPILMHTIEKFQRSIQPLEIILVLSKQYNEEWKQLCEKYSFNLQHQLVEGGETRYHSVKNGLELVVNGSIVGIHDAARPLVSKKTIIDAYTVAEEKGNAIPSIPIRDSIRFVKKKESVAVDRTKYVTIQTPQCFQSDLIKKAFLKAYKPEFTDDATVLEAFGEPINLIEGNSENIKITIPMDLVIAEALLLHHPDLLN
ncbi:MAG: 2-C-methyl-D-erythritol 4-phosphate cytidylyltransferase [Bacteroidia bacterium]